MSKFERLELQIGEEKLNKLKKSRVAIFGVGGVGGYVAEALARSGISNFLLVDNDKVSESNINRQIIALTSTIGEYKTELMKERIQNINPDAIVDIKTEFYDKNNYLNFNLKDYNYVADCIDTITSKLLLIEECKKNDVKIISAMGAGNKMNPLSYKVSDIYKTEVCPLARVMRYELRKRGIKSLKVVYSNEEPIKPIYKEEIEGKLPPSSNAYMPSIMGLIIASEIIKDLIK